jgi:hypothetical protein
MTDLRGPRELVEMGEMELRYVDFETVPVDGGAQGFGRMEGTLRGQRLQGKVRLVNLPPLGSDGVNRPTLSGILETEEGAKIFIELHGVALRSEDKRQFVTSLTFRTGDARCAWVNELFCVTDGVLAPDGLALIKVYWCKPAPLAATTA